jgi:hypothetical protein
MDPSPPRGSILINKSSVYRAAQLLACRSFQLPPLLCADRSPPACNSASKRHDKYFVASQGMLKRAAPVPSGQQLTTYIFKAMPDNTSYPKLTDTNGKTNCLLCFCSAFPAPHNLCKIDTCIAAKRCTRKTQDLHINLEQEPWQSKPETYCQPVVAWLKLPGVDTLM